MNSLERFYATINREPVDRPAAWIGMPDIHPSRRFLNTTASKIFMN